MEGDRATNDVCRAEDFSCDPLAQNGHAGGAGVIAIREAAAAHDPLDI